MKLVVPMWAETLSTAYSDLWNCNKASVECFSPFKASKRDVMTKKYVKNTWYEDVTHR